MVASHQGVGFRIGGSWFILLIGMICLAGALNVAPVQAVSTIYISELQYNPPTDTTRNEYLEFRGPPGATLDQGIYFVAIEGDRGENEGDVQTIVNLGGLAFGSNGYLLLLQQNHSYQPVYGANVIVSTAEGWTGLPDGRYSADTGLREPTAIENASATFMLIRTSTPPTLSNDIDSNNDGVPSGSVYNGWTILDSVGVVDATNVNGEGDTAYGRINFVNSRGAGRVPDGSTAVRFGSTAQYVARTSENTGYAAADWVGSLNFAGAPPVFLLGNSGVTRPTSFADAPLDHVGGPNFVADSAPSVAGVTPANGSTGVARDANLTVTFGEPVTAGAGAFILSCSVSGSVSLAVSGGPIAFTLDPAATLANDETCTLTVVAAQISDVDVSDPPGQPAADFTASFTVVPVGVTPSPSPSPSPSPEPSPGPAPDLKKVYLPGVQA